MKPSRLLRLTFTASIFAAAHYAQGQTTYYWDIDGSTGGAGGATPSGTWASASSTIWTTSAAGNTANASSVTTSLLDDLVFSAGTNATGAYTISVNSAQNARSLTFEEGAVTLSGAGSVTLGTGQGVTVGSGLGTTFGNNTAFTIGGSAGLTKLGAGTLTLNGNAVNTFTGGVNVTGGTLAINLGNLATPTNLINSSNSLTVAGATLTVTGKNVAGASSQSFASTTLGGGVNTLTVTRGGTTATSANLNLGALTVSAGSVTTFDYGGTFPAINSTPTTSIFTATSINGAGLPASRTWANAGLFLRSSATAGSARYVTWDDAGRIYPNVSATTFAGTMDSATSVYNFASGSATLNTGAVGWGLYLNQTTTSGNAITIANGSTLSLNGIHQIGSVATTSILAGNSSSYLLVGPDRNLVINTDNTGGTVIAAPIANNGSSGGSGGNASSVTISSTTPAGTTPGTVTFSGSNSYTGGTFITPGATLQLGSGGTTGSLSTTGAISNNGTLSFNRTGTITPGTHFNSLITGSGNIQVFGGTLQLQGTDTNLSTSQGLALAPNGATAATLDLNGFNQTLSRFVYTADNASGNLTINGGGTSKLTINATSDTELGPGGSINTATKEVAVNMSGLNEFVWNGDGNTFRVGMRNGTSNTSGNTGNATVTLAGTNTITATQLAIGTVAASNNGGTSTLRLGGTNTLNTNNLNIGTGGRNIATLEFNTGLTNPTATIRGTAGGTSRVTTWDVGRVGHTANLTWTATADFSAGELDARVTTLRIGRADAITQTGRAGTQNATFTMGKGTLDVTTLIIGQYAGQSGSTLTGSAIFSGDGTFNLNDAAGTLTAEDIILADNIGLATGGVTLSTTGTFNLTAGTLEAKTIGKGADSGNATSETRNFNFAGGTIRNYAGSNLTISDVPINLTGSGTRIFEATGGQSITVASTAAIGDAGGNRGFAKEGAGTLILAATNTYSGATNVNAGILEVGNSGALGTTSQINLGTTTGGALRLNVDNLTISNPIAVANTGVTSTISFTATADTTNIDSVIGGNGNLRFLYDGGGDNSFTTVNLKQASNYAGSTTVDAGVLGANLLLVSGVTNALPTTTVLDFAGTVGTGTGRRQNFNLNGNSQTLAGLSSTAANLRLQRVQNTSGNYATLTINDNGDRTFTGMLGSNSVGAGFDLTTGNNFGIAKDGTGTWTLVAQATSAATDGAAAPNSYTGGTILNQGGITLGTGATLGSGPLQVNNTNSGTGSAVTLTTTSSNLTVGSLSGAITPAGVGTNTATINTAGRTFTVNQTANGTYAGTISGTGGNFTLGASSTHTLILTGANTYTGATEVNGGTLLINGSTSTGAFSVGTSGTLGGNGLVGGATTVNGTLAPGNSPGELKFGNTLGLSSSSFTLMEIDGTNGAGVAGGHDFVKLTGTGAAGVLTYGGNLTLDIGAIFGVGSYTWDLFDFDSESATFTGITLADQYSGTLLDGDLDGIWDLTSGNETWQFTESTGVLGLTVIPEPGTALLGSFGTLALLRRRR